MRNFRLLARFRDRVSLAAVAAAFVGISGVAVAQEMPTAVDLQDFQAPPLAADPGPAPGAMSGMSAPAPLTAGGGAATLPAADYPGGAGGVAGAAPAGVPPMSVEGNEAVVEQLGAQADQALDTLTSGLGGSSSPQEVIDQLQRDENQILLLQKRKQRAEAAIDLWGTLYNNEHAQAWRKRNDQAAAVAAEEKARQDALVAQRSSSVQAAAFGMAAAMPVVSEINGSRAVLEVPGSGRVVVGSGSKLSNGMKVVGIDLSGVTVMGDSGERTLLGFGTLSGGGNAGSR